MSSPLIAGNALIARRLLNENSTVLWIGDSIGLGMRQDFFNTHGGPAMRGIWCAGGNFSGVGSGAQAYGSNGSGGFGTAGPIGLGNHSICNTWEAKFNGTTTFVALAGSPLNQRVGDNFLDAYLCGQGTNARQILTLGEPDWMQNALQVSPVFYRNALGTALGHLGMRPEDNSSDLLNYNVPSLAGAAGYIAPAPIAIAAPPYKSTTLSANLVAGATTISLTSIAGLVAGQRLYIGAATPQSPHQNVVYVSSAWNGVATPVPLATAFNYYNGAAYAGTIASGTAISWSHDYALTMQMNAGTPALNENFVLCGMKIEAANVVGMTLIDVGVGGATVQDWNDTTKFADTVFTGMLPTMGITDVFISIGQNNAGQTSGQYQTSLAALVTRIRSGLPNAGIIFAPTHDTQSLLATGASAPHLQAFVDANYAVQQATGNSLFVNWYDGCGTNAQLQRRNVLTAGAASGYIHPLDEAARAYEMAVFWSLVNQASWQASGGMGGAGRWGRFRQVGL